MFGFSDAFHLTKRIYISALTIFLLQSALSGRAQIDRDGNPVSWNLDRYVLSSEVWQVQSLLDTQSLIAADELTPEDRSTPMRFAYSRAVNYNLTTGGRWTNLPNGDRIWVLGIESQGAYSIGITFSHFKIPQGAKLYIYSAGREDVIGPLTSANNRLNQLMTAPPVKGEKIVIEYYEPNAFRGQGEFQIHSYAHAYRDLKDLSRMLVNPCFKLLDTEDRPEQVDASSSVLMMLVDNGQRIATGTLLNNSAQDGTPYVVTSRSAMVGSSASWVFLFDVVGSSCYQSGATCWNKAVCGAQVLVSDPESSLALLKLKGLPRSDWRAYNSGWNLNPLVENGIYTSLQHGGGGPQNISTTNTISLDASWNGHPAIAVKYWNEGITSVGSIGSPLFNEDGKLVGVYLGGNLSCSGTGADYFSPLSSAWGEFSEYLDSFGTSGSSLTGLYSESGAINNNAQMQVYLFPNPAKGSIYVQNDADVAIDRIDFYDGTGRLVYQLRPDVPTVDISMLPEGLYLLTFHAKDQVFTSKLLVR